MDTELLSEKVKSYRLRQGLSQEQLATETGLNIRTIQRIENGETVPRGDSLRRLSSALNTSPEAFVGLELKENKEIIGLLSFSQLSFVVFPLLGIVLPSIIWLIQKDKVSHVDRLGRSIINFQASWILVMSVVYFFTVFLPIIHLPGGINLLHSLFFLYLYNLAVIVLNMVRALHGKKVHYVPAIRFLTRAH